MLALVFVGCQTMLLSTSPKVSFVVYIEPASVKLERVLSLALKRQNCAPQLGARAEVSQPGLLPPPTPTHHWSLPSGYSNARTGSRKPALIREGIGMVGPR